MPGLPAAHTCAGDVVRAAGAGAAGAHSGPQHVAPRTDLEPYAIRLPPLAAPSAAIGDTFPIGRPCALLVDIDILARPRADFRGGRGGSR